MDVFIQETQLGVHSSNPGDGSEWLAARGSNGHSEWLSDSGQTFFLFQEDIEYGVREKEKSEDLLKFRGLSIWKDGTETKGQGKCYWRSRLGEMEEQN